MKIALLAPSPVPFVIGGAENLWTGWIAALNAQPGIEADLIKLPSPERNFWEIVDSYRRFAELNVSHFDRVISAKYPAWMVDHPDHHIYMLHKLRGLYDTWPAAMSVQVPGGTPALRNLLGILSAARGARSALPDIFGALDALRAQADAQPPGLFALPGGLIRTVVHALDDIGLARSAIRRYTAISATVRDRAEYFPAGATVQVIHPPTLPRTSATPSAKVPEGAIFTASRLDAPKRMDWVIKAYLAAGVDTPLVIAGDGPCRAELQRLAEGNPNVHLVGRLTDAEIASAYQTARFVPFVPDREDYGLIALEALQAGKPVLTCADAGGVTELVQDGVNGLVTPASVEGLADGMRRLVQDAGLYQRLAAAARQSVAHIGWDAMAQAFVRPWPRIAVVNTFPIYPASNGGQLRLLNLYQRVADNADVRMVNLGPPHGEPVQRELVRGLTEVIVPMSSEHAAFDKQLGKKLQAPCSDMAAMLRPELTPDWLAAIREACEWAGVVVASHPYGYPAIRKVWDGPLVYESHNIESDLKKAIFGHAEEELAEVARIEGECARSAQLVMCCSQEDANRMQALYGVEVKPAVVANGVDAASYPALPAESREALRRRLGLGNRKMAIYVASQHGPNIDGLKALMEQAPKAPDVLFSVVGSVCNTPGLPPPPPNMLLAGRISDTELRVWLAAADVGLNPMISGSGTNLKMLEYAAAGLPIVSTPFGGRGGILQADVHYIAAELDDFAQAIADLMQDASREKRAAMAARAREQAIQVGDWRAIARHMWDVFADSGLVRRPAGG